MSGDLIKVCLIGPAKIGARWLKQGEQAVTADEKLALEMAGLLLPEDLDAPGARSADTASVPDQIVYTAAEWEAAVAEEARKLAGQAFDGALGVMEAELKAIVADAEKLSAEKVAAEEALSARVEQLEQQLDDARQNAADLAEKLTAADAEIAALKAGQAPAHQDTPPSEKVAKTASKKAAATATKG